MSLSKLSCDASESYTQVLQRPPQDMRDPLDSVSWNARSLPAGVHTRACDPVIDLRLAAVCSEPLRESE